MRAARWTGRLRVRTVKAPGTEESYRLSAYVLRPTVTPRLPRGAGREELGQEPGSRHVRSNGNRHACGAISWWIAFGPHDSGGYDRTGGGLSSSGWEISHSRSMPSAAVNNVRSPRIASRMSRSYASST